MQNKNDNENKDTIKKNTYFPNSQKRYAKKVKIYAIKYTISELENAKKLDKLILESGMSSNAFIKSVLQKYIDDNYDCM